LHCNFDSFADNFLGDLIFGLGKSINDETYALVLGVIDNDGLFSNIGWTMVLFDVWHPLYLRTGVNTLNDCGDRDTPTENTFVLNF